MPYCVPGVVLGSEPTIQRELSWEIEQVPVPVPVDEIETDSPSSVSSVSRSEFYCPTSENEDPVENDYAGWTTTQAGKGKIHGLRECTSSWIPHDRYYLKDGNVFFLVQYTLFKVHRYVFERDSPYFRDLFAAAARGVSLAWQRGTHDADPIVLEGIKPEDFAIFLSVIYPKNYDSYDAQTPEDWATILILSHVWSFDSILRLSRGQLLPLLRDNPVDRLILARRCAIHEWLRDAYIAVCTRPEALNEEEGEGLGVREVVRISRLRQELRAGLHELVYEDTVKVIEMTFGLVSEDTDERNARESATQADATVSKRLNAENTESAQSPSATADVTSSERAETKVQGKARDEDDQHKEPEAEVKDGKGKGSVDDQKLFIEEVHSESESESKKEEARPKLESKKEEQNNNNDSEAEWKLFPLVEVSSSRAVGGSAETKKYTDVGFGIGLGTYGSGQGFFEFAPPVHEEEQDQESCDAKDTEVTDSCLEENEETDEDLTTRFGGKVKKEKKVNGKRDNDGTRVHKGDKGKKADKRRKADRKGKK